MTTLWQDIRHGLRMLAKNPGFTAVVVLVLALGIGANTAIFSMINGVLLKSLPVREPQELRVIGWTGSNVSAGGLTSDSYGRTISGESFCLSFPYPTYRDFAQRAEGFSHVFAFSYVEEGLTIRAGRVPAVTQGLMVSGNFFDGYGAPVLIGRPLAPQDDRTDAEPAAVIAYRLWQRYYDLDPHVLGQILMVNNVGFTIIGVLPPRYRGPLSGDPTDFYVPLAAQPLLTSEDSFLEESNEWWVRVMGRLAPGADEARARAALDVLFERALTTSQAKVDRPAIVLQDGKRGLATSFFVNPFGLMFVQGLVGLVLLVACANVAGLLLARGAGRQHEMSVRAALGARRWRLIRQSLMESLLLSLGGAAAGLVLSVWLKAAIAGSMTDLLRRLPGELGYLGRSSTEIRLNQGIDNTVLVFALGVGVFTTLLFGLLPALRAAHVDPSAELKNSGARGVARPRWGRMLVAVQAGLSMLLVTGAGLLTRTMVNLRQVDPGFDTENLLVFQLNPMESVVGPENLAGFFDQMRADLAGIPGVRSVALSCTSFLGGGWFMDVSLPGRSNEEISVHMCVISDGWFATTGVGLLAGRDFTPADTRGSQAIAIVNEAFARRFFPEENPLGASIKTEREQYQIVGLCGNHKFDLRREASPSIYLCHRQELERRVNVIVRSVLPPLSLVPAVRRAMAQIDPGLPLDGITTQRLLLNESLALERTLTQLLVSLALLALGLSCLGLYGLMAHNVARRTGEIGIRMALGARPADVARPILREAVMLSLVGASIGILMALALWRVLGSLVFGIAPYDPVTMIGSGLVLLVVALAAAWLPARRAAKIDPMVALRYE